MSKEREPASGATEGARRATGVAPEERHDGRDRWSAKRKYAAMLRRLRGEDLAFGFANQRHVGHLGQLRELIFPARN
jgi:hypothetical protein